MKIFCDLDGVCCQFSKGSIDLHAELGHCAADFKPTQWDYFKDWKVDGEPMTSGQFWKPIDEDPHFWKNLEPFDHFMDLKALVETFDRNYCILTSPHNADNCYLGKLHWVRNNFRFGKRQLTKRFIPFSVKEALCKGPDSVLIDDSDDNIEKWNAAGGNGILFPQPWNANASLIGKELEYVENQLSLIGTN